MALTLVSMCLVTLSILSTRLSYGQFRMDQLLGMFNCTQAGHKHCAKDVYLNSAATIASLACVSIP